jgi:hypothetical protein
MFRARRSLALDEAAQQTIAEASSVLGAHSLPHEFLPLLCNVYLRGLENALGRLFDVTKETLNILKVEPNTELWRRIYETEFRPEIERYRNLIIRKLEYEAARQDFPADSLLTSHRENVPREVSRIAERWEKKTHAEGLRSLEQAPTPETNGSTRGRKPAERSRKVLQIMKQVGALKPDGTARLDRMTLNKLCKRLERQHVPVPSHKWDGGWIETLELEEQRVKPYFDRLAQRARHWKNN